MKLGAYFSLEEMISSDTTAKRPDIQNTPDADSVENLKLLVENVLDPVRIYFGSNITFQHCTGNAVDFEVNGVDNYDTAEWISKNLEFDQLILEYYVKGQFHSGWIHCSYNRTNNRKSVFHTSVQNGKTVYVKGLI